MIVRFLSSGEETYDLTAGLVYFVLGIEANHYRILDDFGQPYLFEPESFTVIDPSEPADWVTEYGDNGERYAYPPSLNQVGFFEDYFAGCHEAISEFWHVVNRRLSSAI